MIPGRNILPQFPVWKFLNQRMFDAKSPLILNPRQFYYRYQIEHLERCWFRQHRPEEHFRN